MDRSVGSEGIVVDNKGEGCRDTNERAGGDMEVSSKIRSIEEGGDHDFGRQ